MPRPISPKYVDQLTRLHLEYPDNPIYIFFQYALRYDLQLKLLAAATGLSKHTLYLWLRHPKPVRPTIPLEAKLRAAVARLQALEAEGRLPCPEWETLLRPEANAGPAVETPSP